MSEAQQKLLQIHEEFTECSLCTEIFVEPKMLPCMHTFCLKCLEQFGTHKRPDDLVSCPVCRQEFSLAHGRFRALPKNLLTERLVDLRRLPIVKPDAAPLCQVCFDSGKGKTSSSSVEQFCIDCTKTMCKECASTHRTRNGSCVHRVISIGRRQHPRDSQIMFGRSGTTMFCDHPSGKNEPVEVYCLDCSVPLCQNCLLCEHTDHTHFGMKQFFAELDDDLKFVFGGIAKFRRFIDEVDEKRLFTLQSISSAELEVFQRADEVKKLVDEHKATLLEELNKLRKDYLQSSNSTKVVVEQNIAMMENLVQFSKKVNVSCSAADISLLSEQLRTTKSELEAFEFDDDITRKTVTKFTPCRFWNVRNCRQSQLLGSITVESEKNYFYRVIYSTEYFFK